MNRLCQCVCLAAVITTGLQVAAQNSPVAAQKISLKSPAVPAVLLPPAPTSQSPVAFFRSLLAMSPRERTDSLTNRAPDLREKILAKVREYQLLPPDERELRLRATDLRWHLVPLFRAAPADRAARLAEMPDDLRELARSRLAQWELLPPPLQQEFLANEKALHYFARVETTNADSADRQKISEQFNQFFELTPAEKEQTLQTLSESERAQMEKTLQSFDKLPPPQRLQCVRNYSKFAGMTADERAAFLKNAEHWSQMSPAERQAWRDLVAHVPEWPPMPPPMIPQNLMPHAQPKLSRPSVATNLN